MLRFIGFYDYTVVLTYMSLVSAVLGMVFAHKGLFGAAMLCLFFSGFCDAFDGTVARTKKNRTDTERKFGIQIDSLSDLIAFGVLPACIGAAFIRVSYTLGTILNGNGGAWYTVLFRVVVFGILIPYLLLQMSFYNITSILYQKLTMNMDVPYIQNGFRLLKHSLVYALASIVINFPFLFIVVFLFEIYIAMAYSTITAIIGLVILFALLILFTSIKISFQTYFMSYMVEKDANSFVSYAKGLINVLKRFWKILSQSVILCLTIIFINGLIALFTFFSGLFITIPATFVLLSIYNLVVYFNMKGDRYYLADNMIFNPIKYQVKQDTFVGTEIPEEIKATELTTVVMKKKRNSKKTKTNKK